MTSRDVQQSVPQPWPPVGGCGAEVERLRRENAQLQEALDSHAVVDQAIGVLIGLGPMSACDGWDVLREISQHTNIKVRAVAEAVIDWAQDRRPLPEPVRKELDAGLGRLRSRRRPRIWQRREGKLNT
jgi:hypothetical protein